MFRGSSVIADGRLTRGQLRSTAWQRLFRDVYACASLEVSHTLRAVAASRLLLPGAVVSGRSAAVLWGVDAAGPADDVELTVLPGSAVSTVPGVRVRRWPLPPADVVEHARTRVTAPGTTAVDIGRERRDVADSVAVIDALVGRGCTDLAAVRRAAAAATGPGCRRARHVAALADGLAGSPQETRLRLLLGSSALPAPVAQFEVHDAEGRFVARVDFAWPAHRLALEYDACGTGSRSRSARTGPGSTA